LGFLGLAIGGLSFARYRLPLGLMESLSPAAAAADWLSSWGALTLLVASIATVHTSRKAPALHGRSLAITGMTLAILMLAASQQIAAAPWKTRFNTSYAEKLLNGSPAPDNAEAIYTGNLILAQAALDMDDNSSAGKYLLAAGGTTGTPKIERNGPDTSIARILLQRGERDAVLEYLRLCRNFWPGGITVIDRWERAIAAGRQPNFNNRSISPTDTSPGSR
jgi:hypothetical protein